MCGVGVRRCAGKKGLGQKEAPAEGRSGAEVYEAHIVSFFEVVAGYLDWWFGFARVGLLRSAVVRRM